MSLSQVLRVRFHVMIMCCLFERRTRKNGGSSIDQEIRTEENGDYHHEEEHDSEMFLKFKFPTLEEFIGFQEDQCFSFRSLVTCHASKDSYEETDTSHVDEDGICDAPEDAEGFCDMNLEHVGDVSGKFHDGNLAEEVETEEFQGNGEDFLDESLFQDDKFSSVVESDTDSTGAGFLSDKDLNDGFDIETSYSTNELSEFQQNQELLQHFGVEDDDPRDLNSDFLSEAHFSDKINDRKVGTKDQSDGPNSHSDDANKLESLWEHQELIEQLKMELRKVRATGLPTIFEESESPRISEDLKPWKIDERFQHEGCIGELHKFFKSYGERMRKFDILNYQKMYAIEISVAMEAQSPWQRPHEEVHNELQGDLEAVYVGQICLSWEFLHWQYEKALDLWDSDPRGVRWYNEVAGEFQQFQVLIQRFIEDEPFQGPRVQNYVKNRCVLRSLLQVPLIREDKAKDKRKSGKNDTVDEYGVTSGMLVEIMEESIRLFWRFVGADKDCTVASIKKMAGQASNSEDNKLLLLLKKDLLKKERRIKDILRSENCFLRRFRRSQDDDEWDEVLYFFSQVDLKLVCRVLSMPRVTRDQLAWCHNKLSTISFVNRRKIHVQPAFLLFPC
ncbi:interaptin-like [Dorcoceras hygrometricum]|uniref:Interaptin-like n=1 Tax=Dorcoceras hygrometricum TaxID=472368 RepID=A0A2Z7DC33_9LAMI|nr:interaptin-like [Dorcoceras hygrometricum]